MSWWCDGVGWLPVVDSSLGGHLCGNDAAQMSILWRLEVLAVMGGPSPRGRARFLLDGPLSGHLCGNDAAQLPT